MKQTHRVSASGILVYPVYSRRSGGLSLGINMFPGEKSCSFDCPYCELLPFSAKAVFSPGQMEEDLRAAVCSALDGNIEIKDICFSGNGEPTMSADFPEALERASRVRAEQLPGVNLVLITNGSGLLDGGIFSLLREAAFSPGLDIWLKLDAGTPEWYEKINRATIPFEKIISKIKEFAACAPFVIQTMLCAIDGEGPPQGEAEAWEKLMLELAAIAASSLRKVQIYGKARPAPEDPKTQALPTEYLEKRASSLRRALAAALTAELAVAPKQTGGSALRMPSVEVYT